MTDVSSLIGRWNTWWFRPSPPHLMAIFRIAFAAFLIIEAATYIHAIPELFSNNGLSFSLWAERFPLFAFILMPPEPSIAYIIATIYFLACIAVVLGVAMRTNLIILIILYLYYWQVSFHLFPSSYHRIFFFLLFALLVSGADKTFSLRMLRTRGSLFAWEAISIFPQRLISIQIAATYFGVGWQKIWLPAWQDGAVLSYSLVNRWATPVGRWIVALNFPFSFYSAGVWIIKIFECFIPFCLWTKTWRVPFVIFGSLFHIGIALLMSIWWFVVLIPAYIVFWQPEEVYQVCKRWFPSRIR